MSLLNGDAEVQGTGSFQVDATNITGNLTNAGSMTVNTPSLVGDIVNNGIMEVNIGAHSGTVTNNGVINGVIGGRRYGNWRNVRTMGVLLSADSFVSQNPVGLNTPLQVTYGAAQPPLLDAAGAFTTPEDGQYEFKFAFQYSRGGSGGVAWIYFRILKNGVQLGTSSLAKLDGVNDDFPAEFNNTLDLLVGDVITVEIVRDSSGTNAGGLATNTPSLGWSASPSASLSVRRSVLI